MINSQGAQLAKCSALSIASAPTSMTLAINLREAQSAFKNTFTNEIGIGLTVCCMIKDLVHLSYKRYYQGSLTSTEYADRLKACVACNFSAHLGSSLGAAIGNFVGNLFIPGVGGKVGHIIGSFICGTASYLQADKLTDPSSQSLESYEKHQVNDG